MLPNNLPFLNLSRDMKQILYMLYKGVTRKEIAEQQLGIKLDTLNCKISRAMARANCESEIQLMVRYLDEYHGVLEPTETFEIKEMKPNEETIKAISAKAS